MNKISYSVWRWIEGSTLYMQEVQDIPTPAEANNQLARLARENPDTTYVLMDSEGNIIDDYDPIQRDDEATWMD